jgi:hypothetical protein
MAHAAGATSGRVRLVPSAIEPVDPAAWLEECHVRIRSFSSVACKWAEATNLDEATIVDTGQRLSRYFRLALPLHLRDEEESVAPRLLGISIALDETLARTGDEHYRMQPHVDELAAAAGALAVTPNRFQALRHHLREHARALFEHFEGHLALEEAVVFPALRTHLSDAERAAVLEEMRARRTLA